MRLVYRREGSLGQAIFLALSALLVLVGMGLTISAIRHRLRRVEVMAEVIRLEKSVAPNEAKTEVVLPIFRVVGGVHDGHEWRSTLAGNSAAHNVGDKVPGSLDPTSGEIHTGRTRGVRNALAAIYLLAGLLGLFWLWPA